MVNFGPISLLAWNWIWALLISQDMRLRHLIN